METVIPPVGDPVLVVNGAYRGEVAILKQVDKERLRVDMVIESVSSVTRLKMRKFEGHDD